MQRRRDANDCGVARAVAVAVGLQVGVALLSASTSGNAQTSPPVSPAPPSSGALPPAAPPPVDQDPGQVPSPPPTAPTATQAPMPPPTAPPPSQGTAPPPAAPPPVAAPPALPPAAASPTRASPTKPQTATAAGIDASASTSSGDLGPVGDEPETDESSKQFFVLELGAGPNVNGRFPSSDRAGDSEDRVDGVVGLGAWLGFGRSFQLGLYGQYAGLGKERFAITPSGESLDANYAAMTLWLAGRFFFDARRPAFYLTAAAGPTLQRVRATGTRSGTPFVAPGTSYQCSEIGGLGAGALLAAGLEADLAGGLSLLAELQGAGHLLSGDDDALGGCAPGTGPALYGAARVALAYRFEL